MTRPRLDPPPSLERSRTGGAGGGTPAGGRGPLLLGAAAIVLFFGASTAVVHWLTRDLPGTARPAPSAAAAVPAPGASPRAVAREGARAGEPDPAPSPPERSTQPPAARVPALPVATPRVRISFKLDDRLTRGLHMGERWVSPPTFESAWDGTSFSVEARARASDTRAGARATWMASAPDMVNVSPVRDDRVTITVLRAGESALNVTYGGSSRTLIVRAAGPPGARVSIAQ
ncbi:MAG TPA: hypothetical protein VFL83_02510 [Anaeromyxobacter sp.]|nr:hypothetical protein [Anaeromyxobacter sp.]